ncbi:MAG: ACP S-malonyltransferase [Acidimicrobiia bacterium]
MSYAVLFPGQGSQFVGMGADVFEQRPDLLGEIADRHLGWPLHRLCLEGPDQELTRTDRAQPALYAVSYALWEEFRSRAPGPPEAAAGHSLGEYTALAAAGALGHLDGLRLVAARGAAMGSAASLEPSGMAALLGADEPSAEGIAAARRAEQGRLWVANLNAPGQVVLSGGKADIQWLVEHAKDYGIRRAVPLKVAGAFHSPFMAPAAAELRTAIGSVDFRNSEFPVWGNATAAPLDADPAAALAEQLTATVRFEESLRSMEAAGIEAFVHVGPGDVTAGLASRTVEAPVFVVDRLEAIAGVAAELGASVQ